MDRWYDVYHDGDNRLWYFYETPWLPDDKYTMYLSADGQSEAQITILPDATWEVSFQPTDPSDYDYLVTD